ncbi:MAG TPA: hypothetical protein VHV82_18015 [Sporichthyaceae bacterium]|jgi:hypothetical protein|nr:hypothetical protein [Sporichthyaceae bacterium]
MRIPTRPAATTAVAAVLAAGLAACGTSTPVAGRPDAPALQPMVTSAALMAHGTGNPFVDARTAAAHMPMSAEVLAGGIAKAAGIKGQVDSKAADLRSGLTYLFTDHVYITGIAVATAYKFGATSPAFTSAKGAVLANAQEIEDAVTKIVGADQGKVFKEAFDSHIGDFVDYAVAAKTHDAKGQAKAVAALKGYATAVGEYFNKVTGGVLSAKAIEQDTLTHILTTKAAVDDLAAGKDSAFADLKKAADHMSMSAQVIAAGVAKATKMPGNPDDAASGLRADLTRMLVDHVYLAGVAVFTAYSAPGGLTGKAFKASAAALDANSVELSKAVESVAGKQNADTFLVSWRSHIGDFVDYAKGDATNDNNLKNKALAALDGYRTVSGEFFSKITKGALPADAVATDLTGHIETLAGAIDSLKAALVTSH